MDTAPPPPRRRLRSWVAIAVVILVAGVAVLVVTRPFGAAGVTTAIVVFVEPGSSSAVPSYLDTLDVVGEVTFESHAQAYQQILQKYDGARPSRSTPTRCWSPTGSGSRVTCSRPRWAC